MKKKYCLLLCLLLFLGGCRNKEDAILIDNPGVRVSFFNVGKGDAILIETAEHQMLIDTGYDNTSNVILDYLYRHDIGRLDYLVLTHFDKDHVGGADRIIENMEVEEIYQPDYVSGSNQFLEYCEALEAKELRPTVVTDTIRFSLDGTDFLIYPPQEDYYKESDNDFSLVISMAFKDNTFLFAGDCEEERLEELLRQTEFDLSHDVLKVPHHGKKEDNSKEFFTAVSPETAVITCSKEKPASDKICGMLDNLKAETYFTMNGTVTCLCDGDTVQIIQE